MYNIEEFDVLSKYQAIAFDHENKLMDKFFSIKHMWQLTGIWFSTENVKLNAVNFDGQHITTTIPLAEFMQWIEEVKES